VVHHPRFCTSADVAINLETIGAVWDGLGVQTEVVVDCGGTLVLNKRPLHTTFNGTNVALDLLQNIIFAIPLCQLQGNLCLHVLITCDDGVEIRAMHLVGCMRIAVRLVCIL